MRNIVITGGELFNKGAQAMTFTAVHEIRRRFPHHQIYLLSEMDMDRPKCEKDIYAFDFTGWYPIKFARCQHNVLFRLLCKIRNSKELAQCENVYRNCDAMIDVSGYALGANWSVNNNNRFLNHLEFAKAFGIPVYLMPQSFGPFDFGEGHPGIDDRCRELLPYCKTILAREQESYDALVNTYGLTNVRLAPDLVLNSKEIDLSGIYKTVPDLNLPDIAPNSVAVIPNGRNFTLGNEDHILSLYQTAIELSLQQNRTVYLLHHATSDAAICKQLKESFPDQDRVVLLEREFSCLEFHALVGKFDYLIASRFHSIVHAFKNAVPCIALGWATKYHELLNLFSQSEYILDVRSNANADTMRTALEKMNANYTVESQKISSKLADVQKNNVFDILKEKDCT